MDKLAKLKITNQGGLGRKTVVELNGVDISRQCSQVVINSHCKDITQATITFLLDDLEFDGEVQLSEAANG